MPIKYYKIPLLFQYSHVDPTLKSRALSKGLNLAEVFLKRRELLAQRGALAEQFVAQELISQTKKNEPPQIFFWQREERSSQAQIDLLVERESAPLPIEVKSSAGKGLKSMHLFLKEKETSVNKGLKVSRENFSLREKIMTMPFYALLLLGKLG